MEKNPKNLEKKGQIPAKENETVKKMMCLLLDMADMHAWIVFYVEGHDVSSVECNTIYHRIWHLYDLDSFATFHLGHYLYYIKLCALPYTNQVVLRMSYCMY